MSRFQQAQGVVGVGFNLIKGTLPYGGPIGLNQHSLAETRAVKPYSAFLIQSSFPDGDRDDS